MTALSAAPLSERRWRGGGGAVLRRCLNVTTRVRAANGAPEELVAGDEQIQAVIAENVVAADTAHLGGVRYTIWVRWKGWGVGGCMYDKGAIAVGRGQRA